MNEATEILSLFLEAGVAFLGFGALVSLFGKSADSDEAALASARLRCMLELNLALLVCAVLPMVLEPWIDNEAVLWRLLCLGPLGIAVWASVFFSARTRPYRAATSLVVRRSLQSLGILTFVFALYGVFTPDPSRAMACYLVALFLSLMVSGGFFALVTSVAFRLATERRPGMNADSMGSGGVHR